MTSTREKIFLRSGRIAAQFTDKRDFLDHIEETTWSGFSRPDTQRGPFIVRWSRSEHERLLNCRGGGTENRARRESRAVKIGAMEDDSLETKWK